MPKSELVVPFFLMGLLAMFVGLNLFLAFRYAIYGSIANLLLSFIANATVPDVKRGLSRKNNVSLFVLRAVTVTACYPQSVEFFTDTVGLEEIATMVGATLVSISLAAACSLPFEYVMIQIKKRQPDGEEKYPYTGFVDCAVKTFKAGGPLKFYTGFPVYCARISPDVVMLCIFMYQLHNWEKLVDGQTAVKLLMKSVYFAG